MSLKKLIAVRDFFFWAAIGTSGMPVLLLLIMVLFTKNQPGEPILESWQFERVRNSLFWPIAFGALAWIVGLTVRRRSKNETDGVDRNADRFAEK